MARHLAVLNRHLMAVATGSISRLLITMPPRHGKSVLTSQYFPAWYLGINPDHRVILSSYEADFASSWGRKCRDVLEQHGDRFGVSVRSDSSAADRWDIAGHPGGMNTAGAGGAITGRGANLFVIDDPVKNAEEAASPTYRAKTWEWYTSTAYTRLEPDASIVLIQTRWHMDDLAGRILEQAKQGGEKWTVLNMPALDAEGNALWPERFNAERLAQIRRTIGERWFAALYQQNPIPMEGNMFKREWFAIVDAAPADLRNVRYWDLAGTEAKPGKDPDWTVGILMGKTDEGTFYVSDMRRARSTPAGVQSLVRQTADMDGRGVDVWMEQEPGSSGLNTIDYYTRQVLPGYRFRGDRVTGDKVTRAGPFSSQAEAGNVKLVRGPWNKDLLEEVELFPHGSHDDIIDSLSGAFSKLVQKKKFMVY